MSEAGGRGDGEAAERLEHCLRDAGLEGDAEAAFRARIEEIGAHHRRWRASYPAYAPLLDDDEQRAQALAGSYAAQGRDVIEAWVRLRVEAAGHRIDGADVAAYGEWIDRYAAAWRGAVLERVTLEPWGEGPRRRFHDVLEHVLGGARERTLEALEEAAERARQGWQERLGCWMAPFAALSRAIRRLFWPDARAS